MTTTPPTTQRLMPRFLPTLTEVVHPSELAAALSMPTQVVAAPNRAVAPPPDQVVNNRELDSDLQALVNAAVAAQMEILQTRLLQELEIMVQHAVHEALSAK